MYDEYGPTPGICFDLLEDEARSVNYQCRYRAALEGLSLEVLHNMIAKAKRLNMDDSDMSYLLLMKRVPKEKLVKELIEADLEYTNGAEFVTAGFEPITDAVKEKIVDVFEMVGDPKDYLARRDARHHLYHYLKGIAGMRRLAALVFYDPNEESSDSESDISDQ
jgi:hypothetical protein